VIVYHASRGSSVNRRTELFSAALLLDFDAVCSFLGGLSNATSNSEIRREMSPQSAFKCGRFTKNLEKLTGHFAST